MQLSTIHISDFSQILSEGYGRVYKTSYGRWKVDPAPNILQLGTWLHPTTGNTLVGGINLNYLDKEQVDRLRYYLPDILRIKNLKQRYWKGRRLLPDIFNYFYRTYNQAYVRVILPGTLRFMTARELERTGQGEQAKKFKRRQARLSRLRAKKALVPVEVPAAPPEALPPKPELEAPPPEKEVPEIKAPEPEVPPEEIPLEAPPEPEAPQPEAPPVPPAPPASPAPKTPPKPAAPEAEIGPEELEEPEEAPPPPVEKPPKETEEEKAEKMAKEKVEAERAKRRGKFLPMPPPEIT